MPDTGSPASKTCASCGQPIVWRKTLARVWNRVRFCSERCQAQARRLTERKRPGEA